MFENILDFYKNFGFFNKLLLEKKLIFQKIIYLWKKLSIFWEIIYWIIFIIAILNSDFSTKHHQKSFTHHFDILYIIFLGFCVDNLILV